MDADTVLEFTFVRTIREAAPVHRALVTDAHNLESRNYLDTCVDRVQSLCIVSPRSENVRCSLYVSHSSSDKQGTSKF